MRHLLVILLAFLAIETIAQNKQVLYGMEKIPQSLMLNPGARAPQKLHFGVPFLSQFHINFGSSGMTAFDLFEDDGRDINDKISDQIFELKSNDFFTVTEQLEILNFGWRNKKDIYFSGGVYQELDFILYFPKDIALLGWEGNQDYIGYPFKFSDLSFTGELLTVYHLGINKKIKKNLTVGLRGKIYSSMLSFRSTNNKGTFTTRLGDGTKNFYEHSVSNADVTVETAGYQSLRDLDGSGEVVSEMLSRGLFGGNLGIGVDVGGTYEFNENWTASASMLDLGAIFYTKDVESYRAHGSHTLDGILLIFPPVVDGEPGIPYYDKIGEDLRRNLPIDTLNSSYTRMRPLKINGSVQHHFGQRIIEAECNCLDMGGPVEYNQGAGFQLYSIFRPKGPQLAATLFYYRRLSDFLSVKATYTADSYTFTNVGFGLVADIWKVNFYLAADNLLSYSNLAKSNGVSLQLGLNIKIPDK